VTFVAIRRATIRVLLLLTAGAALNVAVAWGINTTRPSQIVRVESVHATDPTDADKVWVQRHGHRLQDGSQTFEWTHRATDSRINMLEYPNWAREFEDHDFIVQLPFEPRVEQIWVGWPMRSLYGALWSSFKDNNTGIAEPIHVYSESLAAPWRGNHAGVRYVLPLTPLWPGFAVNTLFYAGVLWLLWATPFALRRIIRQRRGLCPACAYPIGTSRVCTECGQGVRS